MDYIEKMEPDWSILPEELLQMISEKLNSIVDFVRFRAVCTAWRSASSPHPLHLPPQVPWLILPQNNDGILSMYDPSQSRIHTFDLPEIGRTNICGSSHGWLVLETNDRDVWLLNPITGNEINLPLLCAKPNSLMGTKGDYLATEGDYCIFKAILTSNPITDLDCLLIALFQGNSWGVALCRVGDECWTIIASLDKYWTTLTFSDEFSTAHEAVDISYHNGLIYLMHYSRRVTICDIHNVNFVDLSFDFDIDVQGPNRSIFMVQSDYSRRGPMIIAGDMLGPVEAYDFFMISDDSRNWLHVEEEDMAGTNFFIGEDFQCMSVPLTNMQPHCTGEKCICYASPQIERRIDKVDWYSYSIKMYKLDDRSVTTLASHLGFFPFNNGYPDLFWLTPTLC